MTVLNPPTLEEVLAEVSTFRTLYDPAFGPTPHANGDSVTPLSDSVNVDNAYNWVSGNPHRALIVPGGNYALAHKPPVLTGGGAILTPGAEVLTYTLLPSAGTDGAIVHYDGGAKFGSHGGFNVVYQNTPGEHTVIHGDAATCKTTGLIRINNGYGVVSYQKGSGNCELHGADGDCDFSLGGNLMESVGGIGMKTWDVKINGGGSDGAFAGGAILYLDPPDGGAMDAGLWERCFAQGSDNHGTDFGLRIILDSIRKVVNQRILSCTFDHCMRAGLSIEAALGGSGYLKFLTLHNLRISVDTQAQLIRILYGSDQFASMGGFSGTTVLNHQACLRPVTISAPNNTLLFQADNTTMVDGSPGGGSPVAPHKIATTWACGRSSWRGSFFHRDSTTKSYARLGEACPDKMYMLVVDALPDAGSTFTMTWAALGTTAAIAANASAATLQAALAAVPGAPPVTVEGGVGGISGSLARGRLATDFHGGDTQIDLRSGITGTFPNGPVADVNLGGGGTSISYNGTQSVGLPAGVALRLLNVTGGTGSFLAGTVVTIPNTTAAAPWFIHVGTSTATTSPGVGAADTPALTVNPANLHGDGTSSGGRAKAFCDLVSLGCPINSYESLDFDNPPQRWELEDPTVPEFKPPAGGYTL